MPTVSNFLEPHETDAPDYLLMHKIVELDEYGIIRSLFHGLNGSRIMPLGVWLKADKKLVKDGTSKTSYMSGWHVLERFADASAYRDKFTKRPDLLHIVPVLVRGEVREKTHSPSPVLLADEIMFRGR